MSEPLSVQTPPVANETHALSHGRSVVICDSSTEQRVEIRSADGQVEVTISINAEGSTVKLTGAQLELESPDTIAVRARVFDVQTTEAARMHTDGELTLTSGLDTRIVCEGDVHLLGKMIWLN
ncbi:MAG: hypothetical protein ACI9MC_000659 [Kiritimatiellia bacterium]|jgi:hypothetical protein